MTNMDIIDLGKWISVYIQGIETRELTKIEKTFPDFSVSMYRAGTIIRIDVKPHGSKTD